MQWLNTMRWSNGSKKKGEENAWEVNSVCMRTELEYVLRGFGFTRFSFIPEVISDFIILHLLADNRALRSRLMKYIDRLTTQLLVS